MIRTDQPMKTRHPDSSRGPVFSFNGISLILTIPGAVLLTFGGTTILTKVLHVIPDWGIFLVLFLPFWIVAALLSSKCRSYSAAVCANSLFYAAAAFLFIPADKFADRWVPIETVYDPLYQGLAVLIYVFLGITAVIALIFALISFAIATKFSDQE